MLSFFCSAAAVAFAQESRSVRVGGGYFGETLTHPGAVFNAEVGNRLSDRYEVIHSLDVGFYIHPRSHLALFFGLNAGLRRSFGSFFLEHSLGAGAMLSWYNGDGVFHVDKNGSVRRASRFGNIDFMPSVNFGIGKKLLKDQSALIYVRPKLFWQVPYNNLAQYRVAVQGGFIKTINTY